MKTIRDAFAQYELLTIRARTRAGLAVKKTRRERTGSVPYGYALDADGVHLIVDQREQDIIRVVQASHAAGRSFAAIGRELIARGMHPRRGSSWHPTKLVRIVAAKPADGPEQQELRTGT